MKHLSSVFLVMLVLAQAGCKKSPRENTGRLERENAELRQKLVENENAELRRKLADAESRDKPVPQTNPDQGVERDLAVEGLRNLRMNAVLLYEFDQDWGCFPTKELYDTGDNKQHFPGCVAGEDSNSLLGMLIAGKYTILEEVFYARGEGIRPPDGDIAPGKILEIGECGFSYVQGLSSADAPQTPLLLAPMIPGTFRFDPKPYGGRALVLFIDQTAGTFRIDGSGRVLVNGKDIFDPSQTFWNGRVPRVAYPRVAP